MYVDKEYNANTLKSKYKHNFEGVTHTHTHMPRQTIIFTSHKKMIPFSHTKPHMPQRRTFTSETQTKPEDKVPQQCFSLSFDKLKFLHIYQFGSGCVCVCVCAGVTQIKKINLERTDTLSEFL